MYRKYNKMAGIAAGVFFMAAATGCGQDATDTTQPQVIETQTVEAESIVVESTEEKTVEAVEITEKDFQVIIDETTIEIGGDMIVYQEAIGEPDDYSAAKSCLGTGEDKTFVYGETAIYTKPIDGMDKIYLIEVTGGAQLPCGIAVGSSLEDVERIFGNCEEIEGTEYLYSSADKTIGFDMDDGIVSFIEIFGEE